MGGFAIWHWLIVLVLGAVPLAVVALIVWAIVRASRRSAPRAPVQAVTAPAISSTESRLAELGSLRDKGLITDAEYGQKRQAIIHSM